MLYHCALMLMHLQLTHRLMPRDLYVSCDEEFQGPCPAKDAAWVKAGARVSCFAQAPESLSGGAGAGLGRRGAWAPAAWGLEAAQDALQGHPHAPEAVPRAPAAGALGLLP